MPTPPEAPRFRDNVRDLFPGGASKGLPPGGGGPYDGGMEARVKRLEDDMSEIKADMKVVRADLAELKGKVSMLPGYPGITVIMALVGGALLIASRLFPAGTP